MKILNCDVKDEQSDYKQKVLFMPDRCFRMLVCGPSGSGKTNLLLDMISRLLFFGKIYQPISEEVGYPIIEATNDKIIPLDTMPCDYQKLVIFYHYLNTGVKNDAKIRNYFTNSRNKNCRCIYQSHSYYGTDKTIRLNCTHHCIFEFPSTNEQNMICRELGINKSHYQKAVQEPYDFLYVDKPKKRVAKNFNERIKSNINIHELFKWLLNFKNHTSGQGERRRPGVGFNLTTDGNYDMVNIKLTNVAEGTASSDAITKNQLDAKLSKSDGIMMAI